LERSIVNAARIGASRDSDVEIYDGEVDIGYIVRDVGSVAAEGGFRTVERAFSRGLSAWSAQFQ
jgi:hypothetical protein